MLNGSVGIYDGIGAEAHAVTIFCRPLPLANDLIDAIERATEDKEDVLGVDLDELLVRVLSATVGRHVHDVSFEDFEERLLNTFARNVSSDRRVHVFSGDFIDFVDVNYAPLCARDVSTCSLQKPQKNVLNVFADVTCLSDRSGIDNCERNLQNLGHDLRQVGFAATRRSDQHDVGLLKFYVVLFVVLLTRQQPFVVVVDTDAENLLRLILPDHELLKLFVDLDWFSGVDVRGLCLRLGVGPRGLRGLSNDSPTPVNALVADEDAVGTGN